MSHVPPPQWPQPSVADDARLDLEEALRVVLPDILRYDRDTPAAYPNGRTLTDDVTSARLTMLTNGKITSDDIGPHTDLLPEFPYLGHPHPAKEAAAAR